MTWDVGRRVQRIWVVTWGRALGCRVWVKEDSGLGEGYRRGCMVWEGDGCGKGWDVRGRLWMGGAYLCSSRTAVLLGRLPCLPAAPDHSKQLTAPHGSLCCSEKCRMLPTPPAKSLETGQQKLRNGAALPLRPAKSLSSHWQASSQQELVVWAAQRASGAASCSEQRGSVLQGQAMGWIKRLGGMDLACPCTREKLSDTGTAWSGGFVMTVSKGGSSK